MRRGEDKKNQPFLKRIQSFNPVSTTALQDLRAGISAGRRCSRAPGRSCSKQGRGCHSCCFLAYQPQLTAAALCQEVPANPAQRELLAGASHTHTV